MVEDHLAGYKRKLCVGIDLGIKKIYNIERPFLRDIVLS